MGTIDAIKLIGSVMSSILVIAGFIAWTFKPVRKAQSKLIQREAHTAEMTETLNNIKVTTAAMQNDVKEIKQNLEAHSIQNAADIGKANKAQMLTLRRQMLDIFAGNYELKTLTIKDKIDLYDMHTTYEELGGNNYISDLMEEIADWPLRDGI